MAMFVVNSTLRLVAGQMKSDERVDPERRLRHFLDIDEYTSSTLLPMVHDAEPIQYTRSSRKQSTSNLR